MKYLGCAYYPEYWGEERYELDAQLMQEAGINIARIGEFAWSRMEPEEGTFTLDWLHECAAVLAKYGIEVLMCTPTATPPAWLTSACPDVCLVHADGSRSIHGNRRHYCSTSDTYRRHTGRIVSVLAEQMSQNDNVTCWQLDNEFGPEAGWCHCEGCQARFQAWLKAKYGSIEELNRRWATGFWSMDYSDWRQVRLGDNVQNHYSSRNLDSRRFWSEMMTDYALFQAEIIRRIHPGALVTTNGMGPIFPPIDYYKMFDKLDVACDDLYFDIATMDADAAAMNVFRAMKPGKRYWITETGSGALSHDKPPVPGQFRAWAWSSFAHGADAHFVFRWRTCLSGQEQEVQGMLEHSGEPRHRYNSVKSCFREIAALRDELKDLPLPEAPVAIVQDYNVLWGYESSRVGRDVDYQRRIFDIHKQLYDRNIVADIIPPDRPLDGYRLVVLPSLMMIDADLAARLKDFVEAGGTLLALGQIGMRDFNDNYLAEPGPQHLRHLLGVTIHGGMYLTSFTGTDEALWVPARNCRAVELPVAGKIAGEPVTGTARVWAADVALAGGTMLLEFAADAYDRQPAVVENLTGRGYSLYVGALALNEALADEIVQHVLDVADVASGPASPEYVEVIRRGNVTFAVNHTAEPVEVNLGVSGTALVGTCAGGVTTLDPYGVCVVRAS